MKVSRGATDETDERPLLNSFKNPQQSEGARSMLAMLFPDLSPVTLRFAVSFHDQPLEMKRQLIA